MAELSKNEVRTIKRMQRRSMVRQTIFMDDYVRAKYPRIAEEAAQFYNRLNIIYPRKPDLTKCYEYRNWKNIDVQAKPTIRIRDRGSYKYHIVPYNDMALNPVEEPEPDKVMQLNIELLPASTIQQTAVQESDPPASPKQQPLPEQTAVQESGPPPSPEQQPLLEDYIQPDEEIPSDIMENIVKELRSDPELATLMDSMEIEIQDQTQTGTEDIQSSFPELEVQIPELDQIFEEDNIFW